MSGIASIVVGAVTALGSLGMGIAQNSQNKRAAAKQRRKEELAAAELRRLEANRQQIIDKSDDIRAMKDQIFNPYQNNAVAMQGVNLKMEETDEALANTLNAINRSGGGAGAATALARQAAASKAQVAASIENQELKNQQLYLQGEQQKQQQRMALEQAAIQEEIGAFGRQEQRDIMQLQRTAGLQQVAGQQAMDLTQAGNAALASGVAGFSQGAGMVAGGIGELDPE
tara:strand:- start:777 stop:1460 length:684 start_codon:yes stop_codon:yes gene_type:complete